MKKHDALAALAALAQDNRLDIFRLLVEAGPNGLPAGKVSEKLGLAPNTLTFHFDRLRGAAADKCFQADDRLLPYGRRRLAFGIGVAQRPDRENERCRSDAKRFPLYRGDGAHMSRFRERAAAASLGCPLARSA